METSAGIMAQGCAVESGPMGRLAAAILAALAFTGACATPPPPTPGAIALARNPRATIEGSVTDAAGRPVEGVRVEAVPGGRDVLWSPAGATDADGRFRLSLDAPSEYVFLIYDDAIGVVTPRPDDPSRVRIYLQSGETRKGIALTLLRRERECFVEPLRAPAGGETGSSGRCP
jgi:hypothetical protein